MKDMKHMKEQDINTNGEIHYINKWKRVQQSLTNTSVQFKNERIDKKVNHLKSKYHNTPPTNTNAVKDTRLHHWWRGGFNTGY